MATIVDNKDGTLTVTLTAMEQRAWAWIELEQPGHFQTYLTQWLKDRTREMFIEKFMKLSVQDKQDILIKLG